MGQVRGKIVTDPQYQADLMKWLLPQLLPMLDCQVARRKQNSSSNIWHLSGPGSVSREPLITLWREDILSLPFTDGTAQDHIVNGKFAWIQSLGSIHSSFWLSQNKTRVPLYLGGRSHPLPYVLDSGPTWCESSQLGRARLMDPADKSHHLHTLLFPVVKAIRL